MILKFCIEKNEAICDEAGEFWKMTVTDNNWNGNKAIKKLQIALTDKYVDDTGKLLESNKGIKEMRISAAWLRNEFVYETDEQNPSLANMRFLNIDRVSIDENGEIKEFSKNEKGEPEIEEGKESCLRYIFYIRKAKKVAMILTNPADFKFFDTANDEITININNEWELLTVAAYEAKKNKNYKLILVDETIDSFDEIKKYAVCRIKQVNIPKIKTLFDEELKGIFEYETEKIGKVVENIFDTYYEKWLNEDFNNWKERNIENYRFKALPRIAIVDKQLSEKKNNIQRVNTDIFGLPVKIKNETIIFNRHELGSKDKFDEYHYELGKKNIKIQFLEEISGHNSTFRLTHNEPFNKLWSLKIAESALTKVLIIDERICERYNTSDPLYHKTRFHNKGIHLFNILQDSNQFRIHDTTDIPLGNILSDNGELKIQISNLSNDEFYSENYSNGVLYYDFVLIHQGLIDKIHELFSMEINQIFTSLNQSIKAKYHSMVHSGRSKPDKIPDNTIFVLFSSLEKVLEDCKFSLTELLYSARFDKR